MVLIGIIFDLIFNGMEVMYFWMIMFVEVFDIELFSIMMVENNLCVCFEQNGFVVES